MEVPEDGHLAPPHQRNPHFLVYHISTPAQHSMRGKSADGGRRDGAHHSSPASDSTMRYFREPDCSAWLWLLVDKEKRATSRKLRGAIAETVLLRGAAPRAWFRTNPGDGAVVKVDAGHTTLERLKERFTKMRIDVSGDARPSFTPFPRAARGIEGVAEKMDGRERSAVFGRGRTRHELGGVIFSSAGQLHVTDSSRVLPLKPPTTGEKEPWRIRRDRALRRQPRAPPAPRRSDAHLRPGAPQRRRRRPPVRPPSVRPSSTWSPLRGVVRVRGQLHGGAHGGHRAPLRGAVSPKSAAVRRGGDGGGDGHSIHGSSRRVTCR